MTRGTIAAAAVLLLTSCSAGFEPDMTAMEDQIGEDLAEQLDVDTSRIAVDCPSTIDWKTGDDFRCFAEDKRGNRVKVTVYMENDEGEFSWETAN